VRTRGIAEALRGADVLIGVSRWLDPEEAVAEMAPGSIVFALQTDGPRCTERGGPVRVIVATGRSDFPNQINTCSRSPACFRGALDARARDHGADEGGRRRGDRRVAADDLRRTRSCRARWMPGWRPPWRRPSPKPHPQIVGTGRCSLHMYRHQPDDPLAGCPSVTYAGDARGLGARRVRASALNHHDLWSLRGSGLPAIGFR